MIDEQQVEELRARMARVVIRDDPAWMAEEARPLLASIDETLGLLRSTGYVAGRDLATVEDKSAPVVVAMHAATYRFRGGEIGLTVAYYRDQRQGAELINVNNLIEPTHTWTWAKSARLAGTRDGIPDLRVEHYARREVNAVAATVYWVGGRTTVSDSLSKLYQAVNLLGGRGDDAAVLVITASRPVQEEDALPLVDAFVRERLPRLLENLDIIRAGPLRAPRPNP